MTKEEIKKLQLHDFFTQNMGWRSDGNKLINSILSDNKELIDAKIKDIKEQIDRTGGNPLLEKQLKQYESNKAINDTILTDLSKQVEQFNGAYSSSGNTSTGFKNPYSDVNTLRLFVRGYNQIEGE